VRVAVIGGLLSVYMSDAHLIPQSAMEDKREKR